MAFQITSPRAKRIGSSRTTRQKLVAETAAEIWAPKDCQRTYMNQKIKKNRTETDGNDFTFHIYIYIYATGGGSFVREYMPRSRRVG